MWLVVPESRQVELEIKKMIQFNEIDRESIELIDHWMRCLELQGPDYLLRHGETWNDHELYGHWMGYRSSAFSNAGRIIYRIDEINQKIVIAKITINHNYTRSPI